MSGGGSPFHFSLHGGPALARKLQALAAEGRNAAKRALRTQAELVMTLAKQKYVPVAEIKGGTLRNSGFVRPVEETHDGGLEVTLGFGGAATAYALALHEHPSVHSPAVWKGKTLRFHLGGEVGVKYLERPLKAMEPVIRQRIQKAIGEEFMIQTGGKKGGGGGGHH